MTDQSPTTDPRDPLALQWEREAQEVGRLEKENARLRGALEKIARRYPCSTIRDMRRVAAEAIGLPAPEFNND